MRLPLLAAVCVFALAAPATADDKDKPKPNTLTAKEIADGWILLFDGETTFGWKIDGAAEVKDGVLILGKGKKTIAYPTAVFEQFRLEFEWDGEGAVYWHNAETRLRRTKEQQVGKSWERCTIEIDGAKQSFVATGGDSVLKLRTDKPTGDVDRPIVIVSDANTELRIRSVKLRPLNTAFLFAGKNLDGWKVNAADPKRMSSKFEVTKDGELSVKNGPGDLVTEKEFANFVLQFDCKTLGKALNSGIFFRCIPGQYQNGYEAQIQNAYKDNDRTKPVDFGTGAIYRRVPARKVVSNDNEWFTMTVVADGKHIATWVNGYQTVDWTDDRKENDNPRNGYRAAKGPLSIQGHDPTTDLLFRNIRIAELPAK
jgi:hypothetical protein